MGKRKRKAGKRESYVSVSFVDKLDFAEMEASNLAQALLCAQTAVYSDYEEEDSYIKGTLSILVGVADRLHGKVRESEQEATCMMHASVNGKARSRR